MTGPQEDEERGFSAVLMVVVITVSLFAGGLLGYSASYMTLSGRIDDLQTQLSTIPIQNATYFLDDNVSLSQLYKQVKESVVIIQGLLVQYDFFHRAYYTQVQGSGFVYNVTEQEIVITNYHVVENAINVTITLANGNGYAARLLGSDPYEDLAVLSADAPQDEWKYLGIASSSTLEVGDPVIAVGNPYGLAGSMTVGIVSALGRTITEQMSGGYPIASVIQTSTPINPGNSGGPLLNYEGRVVGITTAIVSDSQGLGFAIPSSTILREVESLVTKGSYDQHPWLEATGTDMTYEIAKAMGATVTYGWLIVTAASETGLRGGTSQVLIAGDVVTIGGDIIIAINETRIMNLDDLSTYLEEYTLPSQTINVTTVRNGQAIDLAVELGKRPPPSAS
ncbi:MAG: trypsin-like peptidase domain-containing protein [Candidatus Bathyarchaeia archaeon]